MVKFIAEISSNHNNSLERSKKLIDEAAKAKFDIVKFQFFKIDKLFSKEILENSKNHRDRVNWELDISNLPILSKYTKSKGLQFCITPFYLEIVKYASNFVDFFKIASYEILWKDLLVCCAKTKKKIILSTGMATLQEVKSAIKILLDNGANKVIVLHCVSNYPANLSSLNLSAIKTLKKNFSLDVGWSDHSRNPIVVNRAIEKWGATFVEMHLDLDSKGFEYGSGHCWLPNEAAQLINTSKKIKILDGSGMKQPSRLELFERKNRADPIDGLRPIKKYRKTILKKILK